MMFGFGRGGAWIVAIACVALVGATACRASSDARRVTEAYYAALQSDRMEPMWGLYADEFYQRVPKASWQRQLRRLRENIGQYRSHELVSIRTATTEGKGAAFTVLTYEVQYAKQMATETFTVRASTGTLRAQIITHDVRYLPK